MADPVSLAASIVAFIDVASKIVVYINSIKDAQQHTVQLAQDISNNASLMFRLRWRLIDPNTADAWKNQVSNMLNEFLVQMKDQLADLAAQLHVDATGLSKLSHSLLWPLRKREVKDMLARIDRLNSLVSLALEDNLM
jgi:hypothetical protein